MKKVILSLVGLAMTGLSMAQTHSDLAQNLPTQTGLGFEFKLLGTAANNCLPAVFPGSSNIWNTFSTSGYSVDFVSNKVVLKADGTQGTSLYAIRLPEGDCNNVISNYVDCSANKQIQVSVTSNVDVAKFSVMLAVDNGGYTTVDGYYNVDPLLTDERTITALTGGVQKVFTITSPSKNWQGNVQPLDKVIGLVVTMLDGSDAAVACNLTLDYIKIGDAVVTAGINSPEINNSLLSVYPNPAKDQINLNLASMNVSEANVKVMNANGMLVYDSNVSTTNVSINSSSFNKGMYLVQVSAGNKISNQKVVIE